MLHAEWLHSLTMRIFARWIWSLYFSNSVQQTDTLNRLGMSNDTVWSFHTLASFLNLYLPLDCLTQIIQAHLRSMDLLYPCKNSTISISCLFMSSPSKDLELRDHISVSKLQMIPNLLIYNKLYSFLKDFLVPMWRLSHQCEYCRSCNA